MKRPLIFTAMCELECYNNCTLIKNKKKFFDQRTFCSAWESQHTEKSENEVSCPITFFLVHKSFDWILLSSQAVSTVFPDCSNKSQPAQVPEEHLLRVVLLKGGLELLPAPLLWTLFGCRLPTCITDLSPVEGTVWKRTVWSGSLECPEPAGCSASPSRGSPALLPAGLRDSHGYLSLELRIIKMGIEFSAREVNYWFCCCFNPDKSTTETIWRIKLLYWVWLGWSLFSWQHPVWCCVLD